MNTMSPSVQIMAEVEHDVPRVHYWAEKERNKRANCKVIMSAFEEAIGGGRSVERNINTYEYYSKNGNKWIIFDSFLGGTLSYVLFAYRTTAAWMECILPVVVNDTCIVFLFTPHFFQRLYERDGIDCRNMDTLGDFIRYSNAMYSDGWLDGELVFRVRSKGVILAKPRKDNENIVEMRTYISDATLSSSKNKQYKELIKMADEDNKSHLYSIKPNMKL